MNYSVYQCITVNHLKIGTVSNSSILQIGTSGRINARSHNLGALPIDQNDAFSESNSNDRMSRVPLPSPALLYPRRMTVSDTAYNEP
ncbi:spore germination protein GerPB [Paenibacillus sp. DMB20]|uniref:spore germination protein GerPB n=1 Tax=Paenibacillus sp. DMB20 TaxID=1642570 RepID=UPI000627C576|nr:hypothetical protein XI25_26680 [Paenibacillus sp. DMB20]